MRSSGPDMIAGSYPAQVPAPTANLLGRRRRRRNVARAYIGTSGWSYDHWRHGVFYPEGLPSSKWLAFLAERFDTVELNASFYRVPQRKSVERWAATGPPGF